MTPPRYQDIPKSEVTVRSEDDGTIIKVLCGEFRGITGPVEGIAAKPHYLDVHVPAGRTKTIAMDIESHAFAYVYEGSGIFQGASDPQPVPFEYDEGVIALKPVEADNRSLILFDSGSEIRVTTRDENLRFLLVSGRPIREPVAWYGPIVMNTDEELQTAFQEYQEGTFLKNHTSKNG
jgi:redox-sensitive bicupin YhaK (pirin superfamily)